MMCKRRDKSRLVSGREKMAAPPALLLLILLVSAASQDTWVFCISKFILVFNSTLSLFGLINRSIHLEAAGDTLPLPGKVLSKNASFICQIFSADTFFFLGGGVNSPSLINHFANVNGYNPS